MWPGTLAKFNIGECSFKKITNPAFVGIFKFDNTKTPSSLVDPIMEETHIRRSITVGSYLGDCDGFPMNDLAVNVLTAEHSVVLDAYIKTIPQDRLFFFSDGERYSHAMMQILVQISKQHSKHITCLGVQPETFNRPKRRRSFNMSWDIIKELADETMLFDFETKEEFKKLSISNVNRQEYNSLRWRQVIEIIVDVEDRSDKFDRFDYYSKR